MTGDGQISGRWDPARTEMLPVLGLPGRVMLPGMSCTVLLGTVPALGAVREATRSFGRPLLGVFGSRSCGGKLDGELSDVGALAVVTSLTRLPCGHWVTCLTAVARARRYGLLRCAPFRIAPVEELVDPDGDPAVVASLVAAIRQAAGHVRRRRLSCAQSATAAEDLRDVPARDLPGRLAPLLDGIAAGDWQELIEAESLEDRLGFVLAHLHTRALDPTIGMPLASAGGGRGGGLQS